MDDGEKSILETELEILSLLVYGGHRHRVYRHHLFLRKAFRVMRLGRRFLNCMTSENIAPLSSALVRAGEEAANELRLQRVDTIPISLALLGAYARIDFIVSNEADANNRTEDQKSRKRLRLGVDKAAAVKEAGGEILNVEPMLRHWDQSPLAEARSLGELIDGFLSFYSKERVV